jgi:hypothetical protein
VSGGCVKESAAVCEQLRGTGSHRVFLSLLVRSLLCSTMSQASGIFTGLQRGYPVEKKANLRKTRPAARKGVRTLVVDPSCDLLLTDYSSSVLAQGPR